MNRAKNRFHELSTLDKQPDKINDIYRLINKQDQTMTALLSKYQTHQPEFDRQTSKTFESGNTKYESISPLARRGKSARRIEDNIIQLPAINSNRKWAKRKSLKKSKEKLSNQHSQGIELKDNKDKSHLKNHLHKAYGTFKNTRSKSKVQDYQKQPIPQKHGLGGSGEIQSIAIGLGYLNNEVEGESSSEEGQVPLSYYQKQYRTLIRQQCLEQTNYLYFSKNEAIKDWTESLLLLFQKHDKQVQSLKKKCKYLQKFDEHYFTIDIYRD